MSKQKLLVILLVILLVSILGVYILISLKKSKESFDFRVFHITILLYVFDITFFVYLLNKIKNNIFMDINIKIFLVYFKTIFFKKLNIFLLKNDINCKYLKLLDIIGEINLK